MDEKFIRLLAEVQEEELNNPDNYCRGLLFIEPMHYLYILYSPEYNKYYVGETADIKSRLEQHNTSNKNTFTSKSRPWEIAALYKAPRKSFARKCEMFIKRQKSKVFIRKLIETETLSGYLAPLVRVFLEG